MIMNFNEKNENLEFNNEKNTQKSSENSKQSKALISSSNSTKKEKKKRNRKKKSEKATKSKHNMSSENNIGGGILSEIKQISIPSDLSEKENLFKILQSEIINIDKSLTLLNKKKKYYQEIIEKLSNEIQDAIKNMKKNEIKNKEYLYMENILKDYGINDIFDDFNYIDNNSYYNISKNINKSIDYNYLLKQNHNNFIYINFFDEKIKKIINNKMEPNYQLSYEEFNNIKEVDDNYYLLSNNNKNDLETDSSNIKNNIKKINNDNNKEAKCDIDDNKYNIIDVDNIIEDKNESNSSNKNKIEVEDAQFDTINEAPAEEEETNNKKRKKISVEINGSIDKNENNKNLKINSFDGSLNKKYSNNFEELDFYLLSDTRKYENSKITKKKKITFEEIQKKYKTQDMGTDFSNRTSSISEEEKNEKVKKKPKKKKIKNLNDDLSLNRSDESKDKESEDTKEEKEENDITDSSNISKEDGENEKKKKKKRKKKKKDINLSFSIEEFPDPENLDNVALALEMKKYGMKPINKKKNIEVLKGVYNFLRIKELPENISHKLASFTLENDENNTDSENDNKIKSKRQENITELSEEQKKAIIETIKENKTIYEKILLFKEISLKEIKSLINAKGIIVPNNLLSQLLIDSGVVLPGGWNNKR